MTLIDCKNVKYQKKKKIENGAIKIIMNDIEIVVPADCVFKNGRLKKTKVKKLLGGRIA